MHDLCIQCSTFDNGVYTVCNIAFNHGDLCTQCTAFGVDALRFSFQLTSLFKSSVHRTTAL